MKNEVTTIVTVKEAIEREFEDYKAEQIAKGAEEVLESMRGAAYMTF